MESPKLIFFKVNMEKRVVYEFTPTPEAQKTAELHKQLLILLATYDEILVMIANREKEYQKIDIPRYECDDIRELKDTMVTIQKSIKIISTHLEKYQVHLRTNKQDIKNINHCIENFIATK